MSKYTTEVRFICENYAGELNSVGYDKIDEVISKARGKIFDTPYPIFDETYRSQLECKIIKHYYTREICAETVGMWKLFLNRKMNEIMPYYNKLYESALLKFNPLYEVDYTTQHVGSNNAETVGSNKGTFTGNENENKTDNTVSKTDVDNEYNGVSDSTKTSWDKYADTPQGGLENVKSGAYLTNAREIDGNDSVRVNTATNSSNVSDSASTSLGNKSRTESNESEHTNTVNSVDEYLEHVKGKTSSTSYAKLVTEYRKTFLNIDMLVIDELKDMFFNLW